MKHLSTIIAVATAAFVVGQAPSKSQKATVVIGHGYSPSVVTVKKGKPVEITFTQEGGRCGEVLVVKSLKVNQKIDSGKTYVLKFTPKKAGEIPFACGMDMMQGKIVVK